MGLFVKKLVEKQGNTSGAEFARILSIDPADWCRIKRGRRSPSKRAINAALSRWPELAYYLAEDAKTQNIPPAA